jgi:hypothetical protein
MTEAEAIAEAQRRNQEEPQPEDYFWIEIQRGPGQWGVERRAQEHGPRRLIARLFSPGG